MAYPTERRKAQKLVLCFDGTGNKFHGDDSDSNILKIFRMLDRTASDQFHYYQPGIGTYVVSQSLTHTGTRARLKSWYMKAKDSAVGSSFDQHVVGGYRFLMRFYNPGDEIYIFGFSRGSYIARFLAEMLDFIGLLSHGNEEMVVFAWKAFSQWQCRQGDTSEEGKAKSKKMFQFMRGFRETFSRPVRRIRFLGLFDTVNSVPRFETAWMQRSKFPYTARTSAKVIRHAVSIDERRAKFRQDLIYQSGPKKKHNQGEKHGDGHEHLHHAHEKMHEAHEKYRRPSAATTIRVVKPPAQAQRAEGGAQDEKPRGRVPSIAVPGTDAIDFEEQSPRYRKQSRRGHSGRRDNSRATRTTATSESQAPDAMSDMSRHAPFSETDAGGDSGDESEDETVQDIDEVWFAGGHGDVGGGWEILPGQKSASHVPLTWMVREAMQAGLPFDREKVAAMGCSDALEDATEDDDNAAAFRNAFVPAQGQQQQQQQQDSRPGVPDIMIRQPSGSQPGTGAPERVPSPSAGPVGRSDSAGEATLNNDSQTDDASSPSSSGFHDMIRQAHLSLIHDSLTWKCGMGWSSVLSWRLMEYMPFRRMDLQSDGSWKPIRWPLPCGEVRDIPDNARVHGSVISRLKQDEQYRPGNLIVGGGGRGCRIAPKHYGIGEWECVAYEGDPVREVWTKKKKDDTDGTHR